MLNLRFLIYKNIGNEWISPPTSYNYIKHEISEYEQMWNQAGTQNAMQLQVATVPLP